MAPETPSLNPGELAIFQALRPHRRRLRRSEARTCELLSERLAPRARQEGAANSYAPLADLSVIDSVSWVAPQLYNDIVPFQADPVQYVKSLRNQTKLLWDEKEIEVNIPYWKIVLGWPATQAAAPARKLPKWDKTPEDLLKMYKCFPELQVCLARTPPRQPHKPSHARF